MESIQTWLNDWPLTKGLLLGVGVLLLSVLAYVVTRHYLLKALHKVVSRSRTDIDDLIVERVIGRRLAYLAPFLVLYHFTDLLPEAMAPVAAQICFVAMVLIILLTVGAAINVAVEVVQRLPFFRDKPIKGYFQVVKLVIYLFGVIVIISLLTGTSPIGLLSGLGALTAVLLLIFRDTILSFVASIQINASDLVRVGDWIEVKKYGADGDVIDIALHTIQVQNFDKTIVVIPTHKLLEETFRNWRGMKQSGGRRIKRSISIDLNTVRFCDAEMIERFRGIRLLRAYVDRKLEELAAHNQAHGIDDDIPVNGRRMTNLGTFRAYVVEYLRNHPRINPEMTFLVRQLPSGPTGVPIEIYVFANDTVWATYEAIQADIFDHLLAVVPHFDLRVFQNPAGSDFARLGARR